MPTNRKMPHPFLEDWSFSLQGVKGPYQGRRFEIDGFPCSIGRRDSCDIKLGDDKAVSGEHCRIDVAEDEVWVVDKGSRNGTWVNGAKVRDRAIMDGGEARLRIGRSHFLLVRKQRYRKAPGIPPPPDAVSSGTIILSQFQNMYLPQREALFVSDISDSTGFISKHGERAYLKFFNAVIKIVSRYAKRNRALFVKCTGDGFLASFQYTDECLRAASLVLDHYERLIRKYPEYTALGVRMALHKGEVAILEDGDRIGQAVHQVCRMESAKEAWQRELPVEPIELPAANRILVSREILGDVEPRLKKLFLDAGSFELKGFTEPVRLFWLRNFRSFLA